MKENNSSVEFDNILKYVESKAQKLSADIKSHHLRKYQRNRIKRIKSACRNKKFRKRRRKRHNRKREENWLDKKRQVTLSAKTNCPDQNTVNLSNKELSSACKSLFSKGPNFVPTPYHITWYTLKQDFHNFVNKLRFHHLNATSAATDTTTNNNKQALYKPPSKKLRKSLISRLRQQVRII